MLGMFAGGYRPIVTGVTGAGRNATMIKHGVGPVIGVVAIVTLVVAGNVVRGFTRCNRAVVASHTTAQHMDMVDACRR